jgi:succinate dehydrogenase/fumarate reductase flavoprotein subunit
VFGARAGRHAAGRARKFKKPKTSKQSIQRAIGKVTGLLDKKPSDQGDPDKLHRELKQIGWDGIGVIRSKDGLTRCLDGLEQIKRKRLPKLFASSLRQLKTALEVEYMAISHEITARSALARAESRGTHFRIDLPEIDNDNFLKNFVIRKTKDAMALADAAIPVTRVPLPVGAHRAFGDPASQTSKPKTDPGDGELMWLAEQVPA